MTIRLVRGENWPQNVNGDRVYGNFRVPKWKQQTRPSWRARRTGMSPAHLERVRKLSCLLCPRRIEIHAHHLRAGPARPTRGFGLKAVDAWVVPLCPDHHRLADEAGAPGEQAYFSEYGHDVYAVAHALFATTDPEQMQEIEDEHKRAAFRQLKEMRRKQIELTRSEWRRL